MPKTFAFTFSIDGLVKHGFNNSMNTARRGLINISGQSQALKEKLKELDTALYKNEIDFEGYAEKANKVKRQLQALQSQQEKLNRAFAARNNLKGAVTDLGAFSVGLYAAARPIIGIIKTAADFEETMSRVKAITRANTEEMSQLTNEAKRLGRETPFTARQTAEAMTYLGMAGWQTAEILKGMPGLLNLALAGKTNLARTADIISDDLTAFGLGADKAQHMADVFAYTITRTNTNVEMLGETMKYAAPVAHAFGASLEETAALAGMMANGSIKASQAGTSLRMGFLRLAGPPKKAAAALDELGISLSDATKAQEEARATIKSLGIEMNDTKGPKTMLKIITELRERLNQLGQRERLDLAQKIFGVNAASGWLNVLEAPADKFAELVNEMDKCDGESVRLAKTMTDNTVGAFTKLQSATEGIALAIGSVFLPPLAEAGVVLSEYATEIGGIAEKHPLLIKTVGTVGVVMAGTALAVKVASVGYAAYQVAATAATAGTWAFNTALLANPIGLVITAVAGLAAAGYMLYKNWDTVSASLVRGWNWVKGTAQNVHGWFIASLGELPNMAGYAVGYVIGWFMQMPDRLLGTIKGVSRVGAFFVEQAREWGSQGVSGIIDSFLSLPDKLKGIVSSAWESAKSAVGAFTVSVGRGYDASGANGVAAQVAANAKGGIYSKGAFLTTFAEESPEAAIPIDGSKRAERLWIRTGQLLGLLRPPKGKSRVSPAITTGIQQTRASGTPDRKPAIPMINVTNKAKPAASIINQFSVPGILGTLLQGLQNRKDTERPSVSRPVTIPGIHSAEKLTPAVIPAMSSHSQMNTEKTARQFIPSAMTIPSPDAASTTGENIANPLIRLTEQAVKENVTLREVAPLGKSTMEAMKETSAMESPTPIYKPLISLNTDPTDAGSTIIGSLPDAPALIKRERDPNSLFGRLSDLFRMHPEIKSPGETPLQINYSPTFTPTFNITGTDTPGNIKEACNQIYKMSADDFRRMIEQYFRNAQRTAFN